MASEVMPSPYDEGVDMGRALCRQGVPLIRVRLTAAAETLGYAGELARRWKRGVIAGYALEMEASRTTGHGGRAPRCTESGVGIDWTCLASSALATEEQ